MHIHTRAHVHTHTLYTWLCIMVLPDALKGTDHYASEGENIEKDALILSVKPSPVGDP